MKRLPVPALFVFLLSAGRLGAQTAAEFAAKAYARLPVEETYAFHKALSEWREPLRRDRSANIAGSEMFIPDKGWRIVIRSGATGVLRTASGEFRDYLHDSMLVDATVESVPSVSEWK